MAAEQDVGGIALGLSLDTSGWSSGIARAKAELEGLKRSAQGLEIGVGVGARGGGAQVGRGGAVHGGPSVVAGGPASVVGGASPTVSPRFQVSAGSVRQLRVDINAQLRALSQGGEAVQVPVKLGKVAYATMRSEISTGIGEVPIRIKPDAGSLTAFAAVLSAMTGQTPGRARQAIESAAASRGIPARSQGGPASANRPHLVGENGPEIHWPSSSGTYIAPRRALGGVVTGRPSVGRGGGGIDVDEYTRWALERDRRMGGLGRIKITPGEAGMAHHSMGVHRALRREGSTDLARLKMHREFYDLERQNIEREAKKIGVTGQQLTHVTAALSSNQPWDDNVRQALIAIKAVQSGSRQAGSFANPEQLGVTAAILAGKQVTGVKRLPFAEAFYDRNTFPIDRWMGRITTLGMKSGTDPTGSRMDLMRALANNDWTTTDVPSPSIRRASVYGIEQMAKEWGIDPREAQAEPWGVIRDLSKESRRHFVASGPRKGQPRAGGGPVDFDTQRRLERMFNAQQDPTEDTRHHMQQYRLAATRGGKLDPMRMHFLNKAIKSHAGVTYGGSFGPTTNMDLERALGNLPDQNTIVEGTRRWSEIGGGYGFGSGSRGDLPKGLIGSHRVISKHEQTPYQNEVTGELLLDPNEGIEGKWSSFRRGSSGGEWGRNARGGAVKPFCSTCGTNIRDPRTHQSTAKHRANARGTSSSKWLSQQPAWAYGYRNQDSQYDPPGFEPSTDWWDAEPRLAGGRARAYRETMANQGGTFSPSGKPPTGRYAVSTAMGTSSLVDANDPRAFMKGFREVTAANSPYIGTWLHEGQIHIDPVTVRRHRGDAMRIAEANEQLAIYDLKRGREIPVRGRYRGGPALKDVFPEGFDLRRFPRSQRLAVGKELYNLGQLFPRTAQLTSVSAVSDQNLNMAAELAGGSPIGSFGPKTIGGMTDIGSTNDIFNRKKQHISLNADLSDAEAAGLGTFSKNMRGIASHEFGHAVDYVHSVISHKRRGQMSLAGLPSAYALVNPQEHFAELFAERYRTGPGLMAGWQHSDLFADLEKSDQALYRKHREDGGDVLKLSSKGPWAKDISQIFKVDPRELLPHMMTPDVLDFENPEYLKKLRSSLLREGVQEPVTMKRTSFGDQYGDVLTDGNHRVALTAQMAHLFPWIPAEFLSKQGYPMAPEDMGIPRFETDEEKILRQMRGEKLPPLGVRSPINRTPEAKRDWQVSNAVDDLHRAGGGWAKGEFFQQAGGKSLGMWKGRPLQLEDSLVWQSQLREGRPPEHLISMADILGSRHSKWSPMGAPDRGPDRHRAAGGDVGKYIIGEIGRELFVPKRMEGIIPPDVAAQIPGTEGLLARLMSGLGRMVGGGVREIGGKGPEPWDAPEDGWVIPNRLMHRIPRHKGGRVHQHPSGTWHNAGGKFASRAEIAAEQQRGTRNEEALAGRGAAMDQAEREKQQIARAQPAIRTADLTYSAAFQGPFSAPSAVDQGLAEANINAAAARGLTGRAALGGLFGFGFGGRARKSARLEAGALSAEYKSLAPKGQDAIEFRTQKLDDARAALDGVRKSIEEFGPVTKRTKSTFDELHTSLGKAERAVELEAEGVSKASEIRLREQAALSRASGGAVQNFAAVTAAGFAFNVSMQGIQAASDLAVQSLKPVVDRLTGFGAVSQQVSKQLAEGLPQAGTLNTLFGQRGVQAGISGRSAGVFEDILGGGVLAKAGATKSQDISQLIRAAFGSGAPTGLTGGYGGIGGGSFLAEQLGGGKGLLEQIAQDISVTRGGLETPTSETDAKLFAGIGAAGRFLRNNSINRYGPQEDVLAQVTTVTPEQRKAQLESIGIYNEAAQRATQSTGELGAELVEDAAAAAKVAEATKNSTNEAERFANQMASVGVVFKDTSGNVLTTRKELEKATGTIAQGLAIPDQAAFAKSQAQSLSATREQARARGELERNTLIPGQLGQQITANPFMAATSGLAEGFQPTLVSLTRIQRLQDEITRDAQAGVEAQATLVDQQLGGGAGAEFRGYMADVQGYGQQIAGLNEQLANRQAQVGLAQYNFQLRVLNRNIRDARGLAGMGGGSRLGGIQREQYDLGRESQRLALESQRLANEMAQRQINFQVAVAGFQAPGITGQERAARMEEARVEADFAQRQLDIQQRQTGIGGQQFGLEGQAFALQTAIAVEDLEAQRSILIQSHQLEQEQIAVQKQINALTIRQAQVQSKAQSLFAEATGSFDANLAAASQYVAMFGGTIAGALVAVRRAIDVLTGRSRTGPQAGDKPEGRTGPGFADGGLFTTTRPMDITVGEVKGETVAVIRNPRSGSLASPGGGGNTTIFQISITGNTISNEMDLNKITRQLTDAVEERLGQKANLLGVSAI